MKKILLVGAFPNSPSTYTYAMSFHRSLKKLGHFVDIFDYKLSFIPLIKKTSFISSSPIVYINKKLANKALIKKAASFKPDIVFLLKAENITASTLRCIKENIGCKLVNFYPDNPFTVWNGNSNEEVLKALPLYDCFSIWSEKLIHTLKTAGCAHSCYLPFGYDEEIFEKPININSSEQKKYSSDVTFVGTWEPAREKWLSLLQQKLPNIKISIWGNHWKENYKNKKLEKIIRGNALYGTEMVKIFKKAKIILNFIRTQNETSHNMRTLEVPASGSFLLTQRTEEQAKKLFQEGENIECFQTPDELIQKIVFYLDNPDKRKQIAKKGHQQSKKFALTQQLKNYFKNCHALQKQRRNNEKGR